MRYKLCAYNIWELGQREKQEDSIFPPLCENKEQDRLFIVCDGMGGHSAGEIASRTVCDAISNYIMNSIEDQEGAFTDDDFKNALAAAYSELDAKDNGAEKKMGTTLTFLKLHDKGATIAHIGDSRVYHLRPGKGVDDTEILFQTCDHSLVNDLVKIGELTPEEAKKSRQKNIITRAMQPNLERRHRADIYHTTDIKPGDYFMLCTDGILEQMEDDNIKSIFSEEGGDDNSKVNMIIDLTKDNRDNHSAEIVHIVDVIDPIPQPMCLSETECEEITVETMPDTINSELATKHIIDDEEDRKSGFFQRKLDKIFINHKMATVIIIAVAVIVCILLVFLITNSKKEKERVRQEQALIEVSKVERDQAVQKDKQLYLGYIGEGDRHLKSKEYAEAINKYEIAQTYEAMYSATEYAKEFGKGSENKIKAARIEQSTYEAEQARIEKQRKEKEEAEKARIGKEHKEKEEAAQKEKNELPRIVKQEFANQGESVQNTDIPVAYSDDDKINDVTIDKYIFKDLGLNVKWAECNVGANEESEFGLYQYVDYKPEDGVKWRLPTEDDIEELKNNCEWKWENNGYKITAKNGNTIFLPAAGSELDGDVQEKGTAAYYLVSDKKELIFNEKEIKINEIKNDNDTEVKFKLSVRLVLVSE